MKSTVKLTKSMIEKTEYPYDDNRRYLIMDSEIRGFGMRVYPSGRKSFIVRYYTQDKRRRLLTVGDFGILTLQEARTLAREKLGEVARGNDPLAERERVASVKSMTELCETYMERHAKPHKKSWKTDESRINNYILPVWKNRKVTSIEREDVAKLHHQIGKEKPYEANRVLALLKKMFNLAALWGYVPETALNPTNGIKKFKEKKRERWVTPEEVPELVKSIDQEENIYTRAAFWLYLLTGVRKNELLRARWEDVDFTRKVLNLPTTKAGRSHSVPLSEPALKMLEDLPRIEANPHVLPGREEGQHLVNIDKAWRRVRKRAEIDDVQLHDLRRTVGSWLAQSGNSLLIIQKALNHSTHAAALVYARLSQDPVRQALEEHGQQLMAAAGKATSAEVIQFDKAVAEAGQGE